MGHILFLKPVFKEMIWGGCLLRDVYQYDIPSDKTGECWAISAHQNGDCGILNNEFKGETLSSVYVKYPELFNYPKEDKFPLLVKIIDANKDLSVQVHPNDEYAIQHENSLGKSECWYVLDANQGTKMVMGHHAKTKEELIKCIEEDNYEVLLNKFEINKGEFYYIPSGTIHAICAGSLIYEAQQSSDITYRVYDYKRKDDRGNTRELHVKQSIDTIEVPYQKQDNTLEIVNDYCTQLIKSPYFTVNKLEISKLVNMPHLADYSLVSVIEGSGKINGVEINKGQHFIICHDVKDIQIEGNMQLMVTTK